MSVPPSRSDDATAGRPGGAREGARPGWAYPYGQYELALLDSVLSEGFGANRWVHYSDNVGRVERHARFRRPVRCPGTVHLRTTGDGVALVDGRVVARSGDGTLEVALAPGATELEVEVRTDAGVPCAVAVVSGEARLGGRGWQAWSPAWDWAAATPRAGGTEVPPHAAPRPVVTVRAHARDGLVELPAPLLGRPVLEAAEEPVVSSGESLAEALAGPGDHQETRHDVVRRPDGRWTTRHALGFRYLAVQPPADGPVTIEAHVHATERLGAFRCSDDRLSAIWATSADTLRLCLQGLVVDGIKRDRMPWAGDLASATHSSAYAFGVDDVLRDTLVALGQPRYGHVNGISDYSLWWLVTSDLYVRMSGATAGTAQLARHVQRFLEGLLPEVGADGVFRPRTHPGQFARVFLDWGVTVDDDRDPTALQMLWSWGLRSAAAVLARARHPSAARWTALAGTLERTLRERAWDPVAGTWREYLDDGSSPSTPYPNLLAVLAGVHTGPADPVRDVLLRTRVGTPFMTGYSLRALGAVGGRREAVDRIRALWGAMLDRGARSFWEDFPHAGDDDLAMYGRPFGRSLAHGWSSGPAALLPELVLGIRPEADGWARVRVDPDLGDLEWAHAVVPTPTGEITVRCEPEVLVVDVPDGSVLVHAGAEHGPGRHHVPRHPVTRPS